MNKHQRGFTLIELMIATAITSILAATAYPNFQGLIFKARRTDGITALLQIQMSQDRWRSEHRSYASLSELNARTVSDQRNYQLNVTDATETGFSAFATATGVQAGDNACRVLRVSVDGGHTVYASGTDQNTDNNSANNKRCWGL
ncbi:MAG: prepilin-type N-terminal cleavage/methylation domain-containing protein [Cytophagales bacterium]|nr:prepilin-type N-terminal cleavage/methylation domain-containing protein [Rhizobacter sp.]